MSRKNRSFLLFSLLPAFLVVSVFAVLGAPEGRAKSAAKPMNWSDPAAWPNRKVPTAGDKVEIASGKEVILDVSPPALHGLTINGKLTFADKSDLELSTEWVMVHGELQIGTEAKPYTHKATITLTDNIKNEWPMGMGDRGIMLSDGTLNLHGNRSNAWTRLSKTAEAGSNSIEVLDATQWQVGDEIVLASTDYDPQQAERRTISAISGNDITLDKPLAYMHVGQMTSDVDERGEVGLLTRNIRIQASADAEQTFIGGHIMAMGRSKMYVEGVELDRMGQKDLARYPVHWYLGAGKGYIRNAAIHDTYNRCVTVNGASDLQIENNVTYNTVGHCFIVEGGVERGNRFVRNLAIQTKCHASRPCDPIDLAPGSTAVRLDLKASGPDCKEILIPSANTASSFWITSPDNTYIDNVAAGSDAAGFWFAFVYHPTGAFEGSDLSKAALLGRTESREFRGNIAHSNFDGFLRADGKLVAGGNIVFADRANSRSAPVESIVEDFTAYKNRNSSRVIDSVWGEFRNIDKDTVGGSRELSFHDAPYWVTMTIPESRDTSWNRLITESGRCEYPGRRAIANIAFIPHGGGPPDSVVTLYVHYRYKGNDDSVPLPINPTPQEFVAEYKAHWAHFNPSLAPAQLEAGNVSTLGLGDRKWFKFNLWNDVYYATIIDDKKMLVLDWLPPRDTFFKRNRAAKKQLEIESMLASFRLSKDP